MKFIVVKASGPLKSDDKPPIKGARRETVKMGGQFPYEEEVWVVQYDSLESLVQAACEWEEPFKIVPHYYGKSGDDLTAIEIYDDDYYYDYYYDYFKNYFGE